MLYNLLECVRIAGILLAPFMPATSPRIFAQIGAAGGITTYESAGTWGLLPAGVTVKKGEGLFPRIDVAKELEALEKARAAAMEEGRRRGKEARLQGGTAGGGRLAHHDRRLREGAAARRAGDRLRAGAQGG